jgi:hypothetical protein
MAGMPGKKMVTTNVTTTTRKTGIGGVPAGSIVVSASLVGPPSPQRALKHAITRFNREFDRLPDWDRVRFVGFTATAHTHIELIEEPK